MKTKDWVRLKTGGNTMLIAAVNGDEAECIQYDGEKCFRGTFPLESLEPVVAFDFNWQPPRSPSE